MKRSLLILLMGFLLTGCSVNELEHTIEVKNDMIAKLKIELENKDSEVAKLKDKLKEMNTAIEEKKLLINELDSSNASLIIEKEKVESELSKIQIETHDQIIDVNNKYEARLEEAIKSTDTYLNQEQEVLNNFFEQSTDFRENKWFIDERMISKNLAREKYFEAQMYYWFNFGIPCMEVFTPKSDYPVHYNEISDLETFKSFVLLESDGEIRTKALFDKKTSRLFTQSVTSSLNSNFFELTEDKNMDNWSGQMYMMYKGDVYAAQVAGISHLPYVTIKNHTSLWLDYISDTRDVVRFKVVFPDISYDDYLNVFGSLSYKTEIVEFKYTEDGWRINNIPKSYESL